MAEKTTSFYVPELGRSVTVRGLQPVGGVVEGKSSWHHPMMLEILSAAIVRPTLSTEELARLSDHTLQRICNGAGRVTEPRMRDAILHLSREEKGEQR